MKRKDAKASALSVVNTPAAQENSGSEINTIDLGTWETSDFIQATGMCFRCHEDRAMGLLIGPPGSGKTTAINSFPQRIDDIIVITARVTMSVKDLLDTIGRTIGLNPYGSNNQRMEQVTEALQNTDLTLIVDETENLITRTSITKVEILRQLHDEAGIGIILCGTPKLEELIIRGPNGRDNLAQLYSRILYRYKLKGVSSSEAEKHLSGYNITKGAKKDLTTIATNVNRGGMRMLINVLKRCLVLTKNGSKAIDEDVIRQALSMMLV